MTLYLDASVILPLLVREDSSEAVERYLASAAEAFVVSDFAAAEVASALSRLVRMGRLERHVAENLLRTFDAWRASATCCAEVSPADARVAEVFVRRFELALRAPDALHIAICQRRNHTLVTLDRRMALAAETLGLEVKPPVLGHGAIDRPIRRR